MAKGRTAQPTLPTLPTLPSDDAMYRAVSARDRRFDGQFVFAVTSTGIFCRPSCPARTPLRRNVRYYARPAAAQAAGFRACRRCRPDALPGTRRHDPDRDLAERALHLLQSGCVDEEGVAGLARRLTVSERHLHRVLMAELGVGPLALARSRRAQTAQLLLQQTDLSITEVAHTAGFASIRQFNDVMRAEMGATPTQLRRAGATADRPAHAGPLVLRLTTRPPWDAAGTLAFLRARALLGVEEATAEGGLRRAVRLGSATAVVEVRPPNLGRRPGSRETLLAELQLPDLTSLPEVVALVRRWFDLDADSAAVDAVLRADPAMQDLLGERPGVRVPGTVDGFELLVRAVVGQQVSVAGARTLLGRLVARCHDLGEGEDGAGRVGAAGQRELRPFPSAAALADTDLTGLGLTTSRVATVQELARRAAAGELDLRPGADRREQRQQLLAVPGVGPWTAEYVAMRALGDPDAFPATDLVLRRRLADLGADPACWRPWRAYAAMHLWLSAPSRPQPSHPSPEPPVSRSAARKRSRTGTGPPPDVTASPDPSGRKRR